MQKSLAMITLKPKIPTLKLSGVSFLMREEPMSMFLSLTETEKAFHCLKMKNGQTWISEG